MPPSRKRTDSTKTTISRERNTEIFYAATLGFVAFCAILAFSPAILPLLGAALGVSLTGAAAIGVAIGLSALGGLVGIGSGTLLGTLVNYFSRNKKVDKAEVVAKSSLSSSANVISGVGGTGVAPVVESTFGSINAQPEFVTPPASPRSSQELTVTTPRL